ncbi:MAG: transglutaminase domain-containing protein [Polyangiales bacterium]
MSPELLPFDLQRAWLADALARDDAARDALRACARWSDPAPLALAVASVVAAGRAGALADALADALSIADDTALLRVLRALDAAAIARDHVAPFAAVALRVVSALDAPRIEARCLLERWLRRADFSWRADDGSLLSRTGAELAELAAHDPAARTAVDALGARVLAALARAPRSLSQAHAEELLAARVYTGASHFFDELLQNADDAGATAVSLAVSEREVVVTHDGHPFAPRDVVGVLSVGQSTKGRGHIGTFGVGFKSVYAVCERPRVYSGPFAFEVVDVSRPRPLGERPPGLAPTHTAIVLPLTDPSHPKRGAAAVRRHALALPAEVLLTLRHVRALTVAPTREARAETLGDGTVRLRDGASERTFLVRTHGEATVLVERAKDGAPVPAAEGVPTLFAFLPTLERTGLRVRVQAPFVVPVDRERVDLANPANAALLDDVATACADALADLRADARWPDVAPLPNELAHPSLRAMAARVAERLQRVALLHGADGAWETPATACVLDDGSLAEPLGGFALTADGRRCLAPTGGRSLAVARWLGVPTVGAEGLCAWLVGLTGTPDERLRAAVRAVLASVAHGRESAAWLRGGAVALDESGTLATPDSLARGPSSLCDVYRGHLALLDASLDSPASAPLARLWDALGVARLTPERLRDDLAHDDTRASLLRDGGASRVLAAASTWDDRSLAALGRLPVAPCEDGEHRAVAGDGCAWLRPAGVLGDFLAAHAPGLPLVRAGVADGSLLARMGATTAGFDALRSACEAGAVHFDDGDLRALWAVLVAMRDELSPAAWRGVAATPWFVDVHGAHRPLTGPDAVRVADDDALAGLIPAAPWVHPDVLAAGVIDVLRVGVRAVVLALAGDPTALGVSTLPDDFTTGALAWLAARPEPLDARDRAALASAALWKAHDGAPHSLAALRWPAESPSLAALYAAWGTVPVLDAESARVADALGLRTHCPPCDAESLLDDLEAHDSSTWPARPLLAEAVRAVARNAGEAWRTRAGRVALFRAEDGTLADAKSLHRPRDTNVRSLLRALGAPLLDAAEESLWGSSLEALGPFAATASLVRERFTRDVRANAPLAAQPDWIRAPDALRAVGDVLRAEGARWWDGLPVARNVRGELCVPPLHDTDDATRALCAGLPVERALADVTFARTADAGMVNTLPARRVALALAETSRTTVNASEHPRWRDANTRAALYAWVTAHAAELAADPEARAALGRACVIPSRGGVLRAPAGLLLDDELPDLGLDWHVAEEVPEALRTWMRATWALDASQLQTLAGHLAEGFTRAAETNDDARMEALLGHLARAVATPEAIASVRGLALHRVVTAAVEGGGRRPPRKLVAVPSTQRAWVAAFGDVALLADCYDDTAVRRFLLLLGAPEVVPTETLRTLLDGRGLRPGPEARLALARYVAVNAHRLPSLRDELDLDRRAWVPDNAGQWRRPSELRWPSTELDALVGDAPGRRVSEAFVLAVPPELGRWLPFVHAEALPLGEVLTAHDTLSPAALAWIERALADGRVPAATLRQALAGRAVVPDDHGDACAPAELAREAEGRGRFAAMSERFPRITEALRVPATLRPAREIATEPPVTTPLVEVPREEPAPETARDGGLLGRFRRWLGGDEARTEPPHDTAPPPAPARAPTPAKPRRDRGWYAPVDALDAQTDEANAWLDDRARPSDFGFAFVPRALPAPYVYAPKTLAGRFDRATQRWLADVPCDPAWRAPGPAAGHRVAFRGEVPAGAGLVLPMPLYGALSGSTGDGTVETSARGELRYRAAQEGPVEFTVTLGGAPVFEARDEHVDAPAALLAPTCPDDELPPEVLAFADALRAGPESPFARALAARDFVRASYRYDPRYLEDAAVARFLADVRVGRAHGALAALHAGRSARHLGAGVCFELNALLCELLRRAGVPAAVCTGWVLDDGSATEPDHLWAMALLPTARGPRWMPLDASSTREGRPLRVPRRAPASRVRAPAAPPSPPGPALSPPAWAARAPEGGPADARRAAMPQGELVRVARWVESVTGERPANDAALRHACRALLGDPVRARALLALLRREED